MRKFAESGASTANSTACHMSADIERLRALVAPVQERLLTLIDARPKQPGHIPGKDLPGMYQFRFSETLDPVTLTGQTDLKSMLNRRNIFPQIGVRGSEEKGWLIYRVVAAASRAAPKDAVQECPPALLKVQDNILELLRRAANPEEGSGEVAHHSLDAGALPNKYGYILKTRFNFRDFGFPSLRALIEACPKLDIVMKGAHGKNKMHVVVKGLKRPQGQASSEKGPQARGGLKRARDEPSADYSSVPPPGAAAASSSTGSSSAAAAPFAAAAPIAADTDDEAAAAKAARKAAKRAKKAEAAGMSEAEAEAAIQEAKRLRKEKKASQKAKKQEWLAGNQAGA